MRRPPNEGRPVRTRVLPEQLQTSTAKHLNLYADEENAFQFTQRALLQDERFEHLGDTIDDLVWGFLARSHLERDADHVAAFIKSHGRDPLQEICFIPVEYLAVQTETEILGIRLLPTTKPDEVPSPYGQRFSLDPPAASIAAVPVTGTDYQRMAERAAITAGHALRVLRVGLREDRGIHNSQLRFRLADAYAFENLAFGWQERADVAYSLTLSTDLVELVVRQPLAQVPAEPRNKLERKADVALRWIERARFATEPTVALLYLFFALEALLGDISEKLKAAPLAFRRAMLGEAVGEGFVDPGRTFFFYDQVRSAAVHGEVVQDVSWDLLNKFAWDVRRALNQYVDYASAHGFTKQSQLVASLDTHPDRQRLAGWLRANGGHAWAVYLDQVDASSSGEPSSTEDECGSQGHDDD